MNGITTLINLREIRRVVSRAINAGRIINLNQHSLAMRKQVVCFLLICSAALTSYSQSSSVKGTVTDSIDKKNLVNTTISLLRESDSILVRFTRADKDGQFNIGGLKD